ncbi:Deuterolysin metalloprotease family-domain-containing protein [Macrophomina phaseolina]|uniref:Neutral protease 2 n=1 Tax=Macrophomina phaseolina TaxID=35725 RepID=A0ABQ8GM18_9PEZI|nr:Deuterolysin metalloprotease family-domain-containing protein [Macrophomina phaseolina]
MHPIFPLCIAVFVALAACASNTNTASLDLKLKSTGNTAMQAILTNTGGVDLNLLNKATILGNAPSQKVSMYFANTTQVPFRGVRFGLPTRGELAETSFTHVPVGHSTTVSFDAAELYDLTAGGIFTAKAIGSIPYAEGNSTTLDGKRVQYQSNVVEMDVNGPEANKVRTASTKLKVPITGLDIKDSCEGDLLEKLKKAVTGTGGCRRQALAGMEDAKVKDTTALFKKVFQKDDTIYKRAVVNRLGEIADECEKVEKGPIKFYCEDVWGFCYDLGVEWSAAYTDDNYNQICLCDKAHDLPAFTDTCHDVDLAGVIVHELSHLSDIDTPRCQDFAVGWDAITDPDKIDAANTIINADSYRLYAQAAYLGCSLD